MAAPASASALALEEVGRFETPTYVTSDPGNANRLYVVEREGRIQLTRGGDTTTFLDIRPIVHDALPGAFGGDYGLFSMAFSPHFATNDLFYVVYSGVDGDWHVDEFRANGDIADPASRREVLTVEYPPSPIHYAGQLQFGPDGYLYASTGDGGRHGDDPNGNAQNLGLLLGKILRIDPRGAAPGAYTVPAENPFTNIPGCTDGCDEIWSYGLRNPWRFSFDRLTGDLVIGDVGVSNWEEVDFESGPSPGRSDNFGWHCREGAHPGPGESSPVCVGRVGTFTEPVFEYQNGDPVPCSITGGYVIRDRALAGLYGRYLYADLCTGELRSLDLGMPTTSGDRSEGIAVALVTSFGEDADCRIYVTSFEGPVYRVTEPAAGPVGCPLNLDVQAKKQRLRKRLRFFATASLDSTLRARGKGTKETAKELVANQTTKIRLTLRRAMRRRLENRLDKKGKARLRVRATVTDQSGTTATETIKVKLKG